MTQLTGHMQTVDWDGETLRASGTNKAAHFALRGPDQLTDPDGYPGPVTLRRTDIAEVTYRGAGALTNGRLVVVTRDGRQYVLHFRRKHQESFRQLAADLEAGIAAPEV